jgi:glucose-6-phosphate isomerase
MTRKKGIPKMTTLLRSVVSRPVWKALEAHHGKMRTLHLRKLFTDDPKRGERFAIEAAGLCLDYSKNRITDETLKLLFQLAEECGLRARIDAIGFDKLLYIKRLTASKEQKEGKLLCN